MNIGESDSVGTLNDPLDRFLPEWDVRGSFSRDVAAPPERVFDIVTNLDMRGSLVVRGLFRLRGLPGSALTMEGLKRIGFIELISERPTTFALGMIGRFWTARGGVKRFDPARFAGLAPPGYAKAVWAFSIQPRVASGVTVITETRVWCVDEEARRGFRRYWKVIRPFSEKVRKEALKNIQRVAEAEGR